MGIFLYRSPKRARNSQGLEATKLRGFNHITVGYFGDGVGDGGTYRVVFTPTSELEKIEPEEFWMCWGVGEKWYFIGVPCARLSTTVPKACANKWGNAPAALRACI